MDIKQLAKDHLQDLFVMQLATSREQLEFAHYGDVLHKYAARHKCEGFVKKALSGEAPFKLYCLAPRVVQIFDLKNFPKSPRQEWRA